MKSLGISQIKSSSKKHLCRRLETELGGSIHIFRDEGEASSVPIQPNKMAYSLNREPNHTRSVKSGDVVTKAALLMNTEIKKRHPTSV